LDRLDSAPIILLVTSSPVDLAGLELALAQHPLRVQLVNTGAGALQVVACGGVAMVLLDVALAGSASFELCQRLVQAPAGPRTPVLLMSTCPSADEEQRAGLAGACGYLRMPFTTCAVVDKILAELNPTATPATGASGLEVDYHMMMANSPDAILLLDAVSGHPIDINRNSERLFGRSASELMAMPLAALCPALQPDGRPSDAALGELFTMVEAGEIRVYPLSFRHADGHQVDCEMRVILIQKDGRRLYHMRLVDVTGALLAEALRAGQNRLLEMVARGAPLQQTLDSLVHLIESQSPGVRCSVMLLDEAGQTMHCASAPNLAPAYCALLEGMQIGPAVGSCGTAMYRREAVVVSDIQHDPLWAPYRELVAPFDLHACWSMPILLDESTVLGSFAMYSRTPCHPSAADQRLIGVASHLAGLAIQRTRNEAELLRHRIHLEELVAERTAELTRAKEAAEQVSEELSATLEHLSQTQEELVRREKLAALGALVAGVAHELNTPIGNSLMMASTMADHTAHLASELDKGIRRSELDTYLAQAKEADSVLQRNLDRAANLISSFKQIAVDHADAQRRLLQLDSFLPELLAPLYAALRQPRPALRQDIAPGLELDSYAGPLGQVIALLFDNCVVHAFRDREPGTITLRAARNNGEVVITVSDDGVGIAPEHLQRVFDPFFTTRLGAGRSGLGLHIAHNIVTGLLGGQIAVASQAGQGSTFTVRLPAVAPR
jgi:PAS domain S-box-containing protein